MLATTILLIISSFNKHFIVTGLLGTSAFFYENFSLKKNLPVQWFIKILGILFGNRGGGGDDVGGGE